MVVFTISLSSPVNRTVTVDVRTVDGSATSPEDYEGFIGTVTIPPLVTSRAVEIPIKVDSQIEGDETFFLQLSNVVGAGLLDSQATGTIHDGVGSI